MADSGVVMARIQQAAFEDDPERMSWWQTVCAELIACFEGRDELEKDLSQADR